MLKQGRRSIAVAVIMLAVAFALPTSDAFAEPRGGEARGRGGYNGRALGRDGRNWNGGNRHYYRNGSWYRHGWLGFDIIVSALVVGALIDSLPPRHTTVVVENTPYYYYDNYYYRPYPYGGYVVVPPPAPTPPVVVISQAAQEVSTINIPNSRGGYTAVTLKRSANGFVGPQGEYYSDNPSVEQLKILYGK